MKLIYKILIGMIVFGLIVLYWLGTVTEGEYYRSYSPDGQYSIYASKNKYFNFKFPFAKFGDSGGKIHLYDELKNKEIQTESIEMISYVKDHFFWSEKELYAKAKIYIKLPREIDSKTIKEYEQSIVVKNTWTIFLFGNHYIINKKDNKLTVSNENGDILLQNIKFIAPANNGFQVLNHNIEIVYYDADFNLLKTESETKTKGLSVCGNVSIFGLKIEKDKDFFYIKKAVGFSNFNFKNYKNIDSVSVKNVKDIYFFNKKRALEFNDNFIEPEEVVIEYDTYFGILSPKYGMKYFDNLNLDEKPIRITRNNFKGYYNITAPIYKELKPFVYNLAKFTNKEDKKGYIDTNGNEYYK